MNEYTLKKRVRLSVGVTVLIMLIAGAIFATPLFATEAAEATEVVEVVETAETNSSSLVWVVIAAAAAFSFGAIAAGYAISHVGSAAMGAMSEKPEIGTQALIFIALAEGLVVFGFITALMILGKV